MTVQTRMKSHRYPVRLYARAKAKAKRRGETLTVVLVRALEQYVTDPDPDTTTR